MRKIAIVGALAALAWAQAVRAEDVQKTQAQAQEKVQKTEAKAQQEKAEAQADAQKKSAEADKDVQKAKADAHKDVQEARQDESRHAQSGTATGATAEKKHPMFSGKDNFEVKGTIEAVSASSITVRRDQLPAAKLSVDPNTKIELDGHQVAASQLRQGQDVKASFNLKDDKPMAVEIKAEKKNK